MAETNVVSHPFSNLRLWNYFINDSKATIEQIDMVQKHVDYALPLLDQFIVAFPKYTLHNRRHQQNIIKLIGDLLGDELSKLSGLETAVLILAAVYHDVGMVFHLDELENITVEDDFIDFLNGNVSAKLQFEENDKLPTKSLIEWYCRWTHAKRVWLFLNKIDLSIPFKWGLIPFKNELGNVCESHNEAVDFIKYNDALLPNNFLEECDLKFCSILLRMADILDFDNTRSPLSVYEFLDLDNPKNVSDNVSNIEWSKHLHSEGFSIKKEKDGQRLIFKAAPPHPNIEIAIKSFLKIIEQELSACSKILKFCSVRWHDFKIPDEIDTSNILSNNYKSGNFHFNLSEEKILDLLTGEGLYNDEFVFIRELLQNAIDTSRHREFTERLISENYKVDPITVNFFSDSDGYQWIRIDDYGMGMNEEIIYNHFLKKGESYYNSDRFKLQKLEFKEKSNVDFVPISRFGIGLLSCFIVSDRIELSTKYYSPEKIDSYRLSVVGRNGYFVLRSKKERHTPSNMPSEVNNENKYRDKAGTSIAVRIKTSKEFIGFEIIKTLEKYVLCSPIPIRCQGKLIGGDFVTILSKPWILKESKPLSDGIVKKVESFFGINIPNGIDVETVVVDITRRSSNPKLKGQLILLVIKPIELKSDIKYGYEDRDHLELTKEDNNIFLTCVKSNRTTGRRIESRLKLDLDDWLKEITVTEAMQFRGDNYKYELFTNAIMLSHNGILIHDDSNLFSFSRNINAKSKNNILANEDFLYSGIIYFEDELLPNLTVSRNEIKSLDFKIISTVIYAVRDLNELIHDEIGKYYFFRGLGSSFYYTGRQIKESGFYEKNKEYWDDAIFLNTEVGAKKIADLVNIVDDVEWEITIPSHNSSFYKNMVHYVVQENFDVSLRIKKTESRIPKISFFIRQKKYPDIDVILNFEPFLFFDFGNYQECIAVSNKINKNHRLIKWYFNQHNLLSKDFSTYALQIVFELIPFNRGSYSNLNKDFSKAVIDINNILTRLRKLLPSDNQPPNELDLSSTDFIIN